MSKYTIQLREIAEFLVKEKYPDNTDFTYKKVIELLGYNRVSDNSIKILEDALVFLKLDGKIVEKDECLFS